MRCVALALSGRQEEASGCFSGSVRARPVLTARTTPRSNIPWTICICPRSERLCTGWKPPESDRFRNRARAKSCALGAIDPAWIRYHTRSRPVLRRCIAHFLHGRLRCDALETAIRRARSRSRVPEYVELYGEVGAQPRSNSCGDGRRMPDRAAAEARQIAREALSARSGGGGELRRRHGRRSRWSATSSPTAGAKAVRCAEPVAGPRRAVLVPTPPPSMC